jgi:hypothetical protein
MQARVQVRNYPGWFPATLIPVTLTAREEVIVVIADVSCLPINLSQLPNQQAEEGPTHRLIDMASPHGFSNPDRGVFIYSRKHVIPIELVTKGKENS